MGTAALLKKFGDQRRPAGLVTGAYSSAVIAMEIFVEKQMVSPMWIILELLALAENRSASRSIAKENRAEPLANVLRRSPEINPFP